MNGPRHLARSPKQSPSTTRSRQNRANQGVEPVVPRNRESPHAGLRKARRFGGVAARSREGCVFALIHGFPPRLAGRERERVRRIFARRSKPASAGSASPPPSHLDERRLPPLTRFSILSITESIRSVLPLSQTSGGRGSRSPHKRRFQIPFNRIRSRSKRKSQRTTNTSSGSLASIFASTTMNMPQIRSHSAPFVDRGANFRSRR
jgi:hypothetical protein